MAFVLALLIVGWLLAFAIGAQAGFEDQPEVKPAPSASVSTPVDAAPVTYKKAASAS